MAALGCDPYRLDTTILNSNVGLREHLVAHYTLDEAGDVVAHDDSARPRQGNLTGGTWIKDGRFGNALRLSEKQHIYVETFPQATPDWSVSAWVRLRDQDLPTDRATIFSNQIQGGGWELSVARNPGTNTFDFCFDYSLPREGVARPTVRRSSLQTNVWHHVTVTAQTGGSMQIYVGTQLPSVTPMTSFIRSGSDTLYIGRSVQPDSMRTQSGSTDSGLVARSDSGPVARSDSGPVVSSDSGPVNGFDAGPADGSDPDSVSSFDSSSLIGSDSGSVNGSDFDAASQLPETDATTPVNADDVHGFHGDLDDVAIFSRVLPIEYVHEFDERPVPSSDQDTP